MKIKTHLFQNSFAGKGGEKEMHESSEDSQNSQFIPGESQGITDTLKIMPNIDQHLH